MPKKIGEALIEKRLITRQQLLTALNAQMIFGGRLGSHLIELGFLEEEQFGQVMAETMGARHAPIDMLKGIPYDVIHLVPLDLAAKYRAIPIKSEADTLHVAFASPHDLEVVDDLSTVTGFRVVPWMAADIHIRQALEKYYGIPDRKPGIAPSRDPLRIPGTGVNRGGRPATAVREAAPAPSPAPVPVAPQALPPLPRPRIPEPSAAPLPTAAVVHGLEEAAERMSRIESEEELGRIILEYASQHLRTCVLFRVESGIARMWGATGPVSGLDGRLTGVTVPFESGTIFEPILSKHFYRGPVPDLPAFDDLYARIGQERPKDILLAPVTGGSQTLAVVYGDGGADGRVVGAAGAVLQLVRKTALTFGMLRLKRKIRSA